jgi:hypothetical protein
MTSHQAQAILARYRSGIDDPTEPDVAAALEQAGRDPELGRWLEQHSALQRVIRSKLKEIVPPPGLERRILVGRRLVPLPTWQTRPRFLAVAASIVLFLGLATVWLMPRGTNRFADYQERMVRGALRNYRMDLVTNDLVQIRSYLLKNQTHGEYQLTRELEKLPGEGCAILSWNGRRVSMVCFDAGDQRDLYLFVINRADLRDPPPTPAPQFKKVNKLMTASWSAGDKTYVLAGPGDQEFLRRYVP